ncbi:C4-dicarboxylate transport sensor protein DctB [Labrys miyagiensis]|uniref:histidine kinase n=1 Tax=Labrys miyagiensis TaxID=346912 RepID=A0ABQ6CU75_9HYPH|nr:ATP-binding protein [Labrys miyagiensis]GLS23848.1 C4-dicarboxylate transport sensor protein DctB [Labrys miyagiensis]
MDAAEQRWRRGRLEWLVFVGLALASLLASTWLAASYGVRQAAEGLRSQANGSVTLDVAVLRSELDKQRTLAFVLSRDPDVIATLGTPDTAHLAAMNTKLEALNAGTRSAVIYLIDKSATAIASSNWQASTSFVGTNYLFRPYFTVAVSDGQADHFALGTVSQRPGLYVARRVEGPTGFLGVIVLKVEFFNVEADWHQSGADVYVTDPRGIVLLTSVPEWRFRTQTPIPDADKEKIRASLQFGDVPLALMPLQRSEQAIPGSDFVTVPGSGLHLASESDVPTTDWRLHLLEPAGEALSAGAATMRATAFGIVGSGLVLLGILLLRRQRAIERTAALTEAQVELERRVAERTQDLRLSNARLSAEIDERQKVEAKLQVARDELAQANRLAVLGQVTAGLAHEVNQPVAAIRSFADNAITFLDRSEPSPARKNMATIAGLTEKIADIIAQLRRFSRKATGELGPVSVKEALDGALLLVGIRARRQNAVVTVPEVADTLQVMANRVRLEQVLVNLLQNALEALEGRAHQAIGIDVAEDAGLVRLTVSDNGPGMAPEVAANLFTPFVTTKPRGVGLGLAISRDIVEELGGRLEVTSEPAKGCRFVITLRGAP